MRASWQRRCPRDGREPPAPGPCADQQRADSRGASRPALELDVGDAPEARALAVQQLVVEHAQGEIYCLGVHQPDPWVLANSSGIAASATTVSTTKYSQPRTLERRPLTYSPM